MLGTFNAWHSWRRYWPSRDSDYLQQTDASSLQQLFLFVVWGALDVLRDERRRFSVFGSLNIEGNVFSVDKFDEWLNCFEAVLINFLAYHSCSPHRRHDPLPQAWFGNARRLVGHYKAIAIVGAMAGC